jgi:hypothetical protein
MANIVDDNAFELADSKLGSEGDPVDWYSHVG